MRFQVDSQAARCQAGSGVQDEISRADLPDALSQYFGIRANEIRISAGQARSVSTLCSVEVITSKGKREFFLKSGRINAKQARLAEIARSVFAEDAAVFLPRTALLSGGKYLLAEKFEGHSIGKLCSWSLPSSKFVLGVNLNEALSRAGKWLRRFHQSSISCSSVTASHLHFYMERRKEALAFLTQEQIRTLIRLIDSTADSTAAVLVHGDFSPENVLVDRNRVCVLDFGVPEWDEISPAWDVATMVVALEKCFSTSWRNSVHWFPRRSSAALAAFLTAYGDFDCRSPEYMASLCLRHLAGSMKVTRAGEPNAEAKWHRARLTEILVE